MVLAVFCTCALLGALYYITLQWRALNWGGTAADHQRQREDHGVLKFTVGKFISLRGSVGVGTAHGRKAERAARLLSTECSCKFKLDFARVIIDDQGRF